MVTLKGYTANMLGLSTDQKPTDAEVNTIIRELDTNKYYYFDGTNWNEIPSTGGGGGGFTPTQTQLDAMNSGIDSTKVAQIAQNADDIGKTESKIFDLAEDLGTKQDTLVVGTNLDAVPTENSTNPITSGGIYNVIGDINTVLKEVL